jgi:hypothetical protein
LDVRQKTLMAGTYVRFKRNPLGLRNRFAEVISDECGSLRVRTEGGEACCVRHEVAVCRSPSSRTLRPLRQTLPYGKWTCDDGREVLFNRDYKPMWQRLPHQQAESADPVEWVPHVRQEWFYDDSSVPWKNAASERRCVDILRNWGVYNASLSP